jgi:hypothetical protein
MKPMATLLLVLFFSLSATCQRPASEALPAEAGKSGPQSPPAASPAPVMKAQGKTIHALVALCDNQFQGIVPVPARIGNGDDPVNNLYWGAAYGVKSFFMKSKDWKLIAAESHPKTEILERVVIKYRAADVYLVADAYRGREIKRCVTDFFDFAAGRRTEMLSTTGGSLEIGGGADLIAYVGHDGLMDFSLDSYPRRADSRRRDAIILACASKSHFAEPLRETGANPLLWTTGLMAPEAYVLKAAIDGWISEESGEKIRRRAAAVYNQYQRCGLNASLRLFSTGW